MSKEHTGAVSDVEKTDWERVRNLTDEEIQAALESDPDINPTDEDFWKDAKLVLPRRKETVTIRLDADILEWLRQKKGYQTRINAILRAYMHAQMSPPQDR